MCEGMVGGEGEEVAGGGAELVDEVRCLLADAAGGLNGEGDEVPPAGCRRPPRTCGTWLQRRAWP